MSPNAYSSFTIRLSFCFLKGHGDGNSRNVPTLVKDVSCVGQVVCGSSHTIAVSQDGRTVWSFGGGDNGNGSLLRIILMRRNMPMLRIGCLFHVS